jgi:hypothetical protein
MLSHAILIKPGQYDASAVYSQHLAVRTYLALGEHEKSPRLLERLLSMPYHLAAWLGWIRHSRRSEIQGSKADGAAS